MPKQHCVMALALACVACAERTAAPVPVEHYEMPLWTASGEIVGVGAIRVLSDGRVIIADFKEKDVWLFGADGKPLHNVPNHGSGPNEYQRVQGLFALPGDSTLIFDDSQRRLVVLDEQAKPVRTIALTSKIPQAGLVGGAQTDHRGRLITRSAMSIDSAGQDVPLIRWDWKTDRLDTIARTVVPRNLTVKSEQLWYEYLVPFSPRDWFHPMPNGDIAIIRASTYHVDLVDSLGTLRHGDSVPFTPQPVTQADREEEDVAMRRLLPSTKPPFDGNYTVVSNDGEMWVRRQVAVDTDSVNYDVLNANGTRQRIVRLGPRRWVLSVTADRVYISRFNEEDFEVLDAFARK